MSKELAVRTVVAPVPTLLEVNRLKFCAIFLLYKAILIAIANPADTSPSAPSVPSEPAAPVAPVGMPNVKFNWSPLTLADPVALEPADNVFVVNETVDLAPINEKISDLEVEILDRMSALEDEWMARDNDTNDDILNDIAGLKSDVEDLFDKASKADNQLQLNIVELSDKTFIEFGCHF